MARIATLEADLAAEQQRSAGHRADFERECERAGRMVTIQDRLMQNSKISALFWKRHSNLPDRSPPRTWREMSWPERWRWLRAPRVRS
jgi:hypothetical protein